jgi:hypothetical protein
MLQKANESLVGGNSTMISLGGYGGYVVFGFDHTIPNLKGRDFKVLEMHSLELPVISVQVPVSRELLWWPMTETKTESLIMTSGTKLPAVNISKIQP